MTSRSTACSFRAPASLNGARSFLPDDSPTRRRNPYGSSLRPAPIRSSARIYAVLLARSKNRREYQPQIVTARLMSLPLARKAGHASSTTSFGRLHWRLRPRTNPVLGKFSTGGSWSADTYSLASRWWLFPRIGGQKPASSVC